MGSELLLDTQFRSLLLPFGLLFGAETDRVNRVGLALAAGADLELRSGAVWSDCHRSLHRELQCGRVISDTEGLGAAGASNRDDSREGKAGCHCGREGHTAWTDHHGAGAWRVTATSTELDSV